MRPRWPDQPAGHARVSAIWTIELVVGGEAEQLLAVDRVVQRARGVEDARCDRPVRRDPVAQHRSQRDDARAAGDQLQRPGQRRLPDEVAPDRPAQLELIAGLEHVREVRGDLAVVEPLDREREEVVLRRGGDGVAALGLVAVLGGEADVHVLAGAVAGPPGQVEHDALRPRGLGHELDHAGELPGQSP